jgi:hypothetical protein
VTDQSYLCLLVPEAGAGAGAGAVAGRVPRSGILAGQHDRHGGIERGILIVQLDKIFGKMLRQRVQSLWKMPMMRPNSLETLSNLYFPRQRVYLFCPWLTVTMVTYSISRALLIQVLRQTIIEKFRRSPRWT